MTSDLTPDLARISELLRILGPDWREATITGHLGTRLMHKDGYGVRLRVETQRINMTGVWPTSASDKVNGRENWPRGGGPTITVAVTATPDKIVKAINGRFLPAYLPLWNEQLAQTQQTDAFNTKTEQTIATLTTLPGVRKSPHSDALYVSDAHCYGVSVNGDSVRFDAFSVPLAVALKILPLLRNK